MATGRQPEAAFFRVGVYLPGSVLAKDRRPGSVLNVQKRGRRGGEALELTVLEDVPGVLRLLGE